MLLIIEAYFENSAACQLKVGSDRFAYVTSLIVRSVLCAEVIQRATTEQNESGCNSCNYYRIIIRYGE